MTYRDEIETLRARVAELEGELGVANERIARLSGETPDETAKNGYSRFLGTHTELQRERVFDFEASALTFEAIAQLWRQRFPAGQVSQVGRELVLKGGLAQVHIAAKDGRTSVRLTGSLKGHGVLVAATTPAVAIFTLAPLVALAKAYMWSKANIIWMVPAAVILAFTAMRALWRRAAVNAEKTMNGAFEAINEIVAGEAPEKKGLRVVTVSDPPAATEALALEEENAQEDAASAIAHDA